MESAQSKIGALLNCYYATALRIYNQFVFIGSFIEKGSSGRANKGNEMGEIFFVL